MRNFSIILAYIGIVVVCIVLSTATYAYVTYEEEEKKVVGRMKAAKGIKMVLIFVLIQTIA